MIKLLLSILAVAVFFALHAPAQSFLTNGLLAYYPFDGTVDDASGNANNGTNYGATYTQDRFGFTNRAIYFSNNAYVLTGFFPPLGSASRTFSGWFNVSSSSDMALIFYGGNGNNPGDRFEPRIAGQFTVDCSWGYLVTANSYNDAKWHSFIVVVPPNSAVSNMLFYLDGILQTNNSSAYPGTPLNTASSYPLQFGEFLAGQPLTGALDDVRIFNRALSSNEVSQLYAYDSTPPIQITQDLTNFSVVYGHNTTLSIGASGNSPLVYQWYFSPSNNAGQAGAYAQIIDDFVYGAVVTNGGYGYGNVPSVTFVGGGGSGASGYGIVSNGVLIAITVTNAGTGYTSLPNVVIDPPNGYLYRQTNNSLTISNATQNDLGNYYVVISNTNLTTTSSTVNLTLLYPPTFTLNPVGFSADYGSSNTLFVNVSGTQPISYQWILNGTSIPGATNDDYSIDFLDVTNTGAYYVVASNLYGTNFSYFANVVMLPSLTAPFEGAIGVWGQDVELSVGAVGSGNLSYQWYFDGTAISAATGSNYVLSGIQFTNAGLYNVVVTSSYGSATNTAYQVVVEPATTAIGTCPIIYLTGTPGYTYDIQSSTDLSNTNSWITVTNITIPYSPFIWADTATDISKPGNPRKFYRVLSGP